MEKFRTWNIESNKKNRLKIGRNTQLKVSAENTFYILKLYCRVVLFKVRIVENMKCIHIKNKKYSPPIEN